MKLRKLNKLLHRDLGYFFSGMILIYAISGIAINHKHDWNPNYIIERYENSFMIEENYDINSMEFANILMQRMNITETYKKHYNPTSNSIKIFLTNGSSISYNTKNSIIIYESIKNRPIFKSFNFLHYNPGKLWKYFSDIFAICLIFLVISGSIIIKGKNGFIFRGLVLTALGILLPFALLFFYLNN